jgi:outer membrane protein OmpA-like peptidoglycan-associated protein
MDEEDVFISANGLNLYFSSNGHAGMGDLDIYRSSFDSAKMQWTEPLNLGYPVNSVENDIYFVLSGDERYAYISSVRDDTKGDQDIYRVDLLNWKPITRQELMEKEMQSSHLTPVISYVESKQALTNNATLTPSNTTTVKKYEPIGLTVETTDEDGKSLDAKVSLTDQQSKEILLTKLSAGAYSASIANESDKQYKVKAEAAGYIPSYATLHVVGQSETHTLKEILVLRKAELNAEIILNLYYNSNQATVSNPQDLDVIKSLMTENPTVKIQVDGHTDSNGDEAYNLQLSKARAENVKKVLVQSGIEESRITTNGFGETRPITNNSTYSARKLNRRTTFTIVAK